jgi:hypothetical protein
MMKKLIIMLLISAMTYACSAAVTPEIEYVVQRNVPDSPSFIVFPIDGGQIQATCSTLAEGALIAARVFSGKFMERN